MHIACYCAKGILHQGVNLGHLPVLPWLWIYLLNNMKKLVSQRVFHVVGIVLPRDLWNQLIFNYA